MQFLSHFSGEDVSVRWPQCHFARPLTFRKVLYLLLKMVGFLLELFHALFQIGSSIFLRLEGAEKFYMPQQIANVRSMSHPILVASVEVIECGSGVLF